MSPRGPRPSPGPGAGRLRRRTSAELDALLDGGMSGDPRLDQVLTAARGPALESELAIPAPAVGAEPLAEGPSRSRRVLTRLGAATLVTKAVTAAVGAAVVGAAAVAGATHHLPGQHRPHPAPVRGSTTDSSSHSAPGSDGPSSGGSTSAKHSSASSSASTSPSGSPTVTGAANIPSLCQAWLALPAGADAARREPRFVVLIHAAGSAQAVTAFCRNQPSRSASGTASLSGSSSTSGSASPAPSRTSTSTRRTATTSQSASPTKR